MNEQLKPLFYELQVQQVKLAAEAAKVSLTYTAENVPADLREIFLIGVKMAHIAKAIEAVSKTNPT